MKTFRNRSIEVTRPRADELDLIVRWIDEYKRDLFDTYLFFTPENEDLFYKLINEKFVGEAITEKLINEIETFAYILLEKFYSEVQVKPLIGKKLF